MLKSSLGVQLSLSSALVVLRHAHCKECVFVRTLPLLCYNKTYFSSIAFYIVSILLGQIPQWLILKVTCQIMCWSKTSTNHSLYQVCPLPCSCKHCISIQPQQSILHSCEKLDKYSTQNYSVLYRMSIGRHI